VTGEVPVLGGRVADPTSEDAAAAHVVALVVPWLADLCAVHLFDRDGTARCVATAAADGVDRGVAGQLTAMLHPTHDWARLGRAIPVRSVVSVPLALDEQARGVITAATVQSNRRLGSRDVAFLRQIGRQAALVLENRRLAAALEEVRSAVRRAEHDIRNPLAVITMHAELSQIRATSLDTPEGAQFEASMARILSAAATARGLVAALGSRCEPAAERPS
jgi:GAF domain-containing protein